MALVVEINARRHFACAKPLPSHERVCSLSNRTHRICIEKGRFHENARTRTANPLMGGDCTDEVQTSHSKGSEKTVLDPVYQGI
jgi:hypothetical protein